MIAKFIEATNAEGGGGINWGKFLVCRFSPEEWAYRSALPGAEGRRLLQSIGKHPEQLLVIDLQTGEGAIFRPGGYAKADLDKHKIWVCPMYQPFLEWLYKQDLTDLSALPSLVNFSDREAPSAFSGYRRQGEEKGTDGVAADGGAGDDRPQGKAENR